MVSPIFKGGFGVTKIEAVSLNGEAVAFFSPGAFAGAPSGFDALDYLSRRQVTGWSTVPVMPPAPLLPERLHNDVTPSLDMVLKLGKPGPNEENALPAANLLLHPTETPDTIDNWEFVGSVMPIAEGQGFKEKVLTQYESTSASFCNVLLGSTGVEPLVAEAVGVSSLELYEFDRGCDGRPKSLALVGLNNEGKAKLLNRECDSSIGDQIYAPVNGSVFNAVSTDGGEVFFTVCVSGNESVPSSPHQLFVRLGGSKTLEISRPREPGCVANSASGEVPCDGAASRPSADFAGASEDGSKVYFTTNAPLAESDKDAGNDVYMASIGCPVDKPGCGVVEREVTSLTQVSRDPSAGQATEVQGVVRVAPDGSRVYYVARGIPIEQNSIDVFESENRPVPRVGADNLYEYDSSSGTTAFIGDLCSGTELSGTVEDVGCPSTAGTDEPLWTGSVEGNAQTAATDGRFLVFATYAQLRKSDTNAVKDVYRFDADTGLLLRVSGGEGGYDSDGNHGVFGENGEALGASITPGHHGGGLLEQYELDSRAISEDGSRVVFMSAAPLSPQASNGLENAYEWHEDGVGGEGNVSLISSGGSVEPVTEVVISPDGTNVYFNTTEGLVPQDVDGALDIYDARLGGGFPQQQAERRPCEGDACQGPLTNPTPLLVPGSVAQSPGGNFAAPTKQPAKPKKTKAKKKTKRKKKTKAKRARGKKARKATGRFGRVEKTVVRSGR